MITRHMGRREPNNDDDHLNETGISDSVSRGYPAGSGFAWIDRPLDLLQRKARKNYRRGGMPEGRGLGQGRLAKKITLAWVRVWSARNESLMERTTSSGVDGRSRDAMRKKKDIFSSRVARGDFSFLPRRVSGGPRRRGRGVIMHTHWRQCLQTGAAGRLRWRRTFCLLCIWPRIAFTSNTLPLTILLLLFTPHYY